MQEQLGLPLVRKPSTGGAKVAIRKTISSIDREGANYGSDLAIAHIRLPSLLGILWERSLRRN